MKIANFATNFFIFAGTLWVLYRIVMSFESGMINGMVHIVALGIYTLIITYICKYYKK